MLQSLADCKPAKQLSMGGYAATVAIDLQARWMAAIDAEALMLFRRLHLPGDTLCRSWEGHCFTKHGRWI